MRFGVYHPCKPKPLFVARSTPAKSVGRVEAPDAEAAIEVAAKEFKVDPKRLMAVRRG
jgi:hypothetical protein